MIIDSISNKRKILAEFLDLCIIEGWNDQALEAAVLKAGIEKEFSNLIFENGVSEIADFFIAEDDANMVEKISHLDLDQMKVRDKIKEIIKIRLMIIEPHKMAVKRLINFYFHFKKLHHAIKNCYKTADLIWYQIKDKSTDFNFYTKRIILAKVYTRSLLYFINDNSENNYKSWEFLDKQIDKIIQFEKFKFGVKSSIGKVEKASEKMSQYFSNQSAKDLIKKLPFIRLFNFKK